MAEKYELAYVDYKAGMKQKDIAAKYDVTINTVKSWQQRKWKEMDAEGAGEKVCTPQESMHTKKESSGTNRKDRQSAEISEKKDRRRSGNPNPSYSFPKHNNAAEKHGFYSRVIPPELMGMFEEIEDSISMADMLWDQIKLQYMAIMRAQSIMFVTNKDEMIKEIKKEKYGYSEVETTNEEGKTESKYERTLDEVEYEFQFAWERQAQFLNAQSRAISELRASIKQFEEAADKTDERRLKLQQMQLSIEKTKEETIRIQKLNEAGNQQNTEEKLAEYFTALQGAFINEPSKE